MAEKVREETKRLCLSEGTWAGFDHSHEGDLIGTHHVEDAAEAALAICAQRYQSGTHLVLVVSPEKAQEFWVSFDTEEVTPDA